MNQEIILGIVRHALTIIGGILVQRGAIEAGQADTITGAIIALVGVGWSIWHKVGKPPTGGTPVAALLLCAALGTGCANVSYQETRTDGTVTKFHAATIFDNSKLSKLSLAKKTEKTSQGLSLGGLDTDVSVEGIKAAGDVAEQLLRAGVDQAIKSGAKAVKP